MKHIIKTLFVLSVVLWIIPAQAHHAFSATFTTDEITVKGTVTRLSFTNPHVMVYFDITDENGEVTEWVAEGGSATSLRRQGWSRESLKSGDLISISGNSARNGSPMVSMGEINLVNPQTGAVLGDPGTAAAVTVEAAVSTSITMTLADGRPNLSGAWVQNPIVPGAPPRRRGPPPEAGGDGSPSGMGRPPEASGEVSPRFAKSPNKINLPGGSRRDGKPPLSAAGEALMASFDTSNDPQVQCEPVGLVRQAGATPHPISLQQFDDRIELAYEEYGDKRTVYFDDRDLVGGDHSRFGQSIARYEGETLVIETTHLTAGWARPLGPILSDQTTTTQRFTRIPDENGVSMIQTHMIIEDPVMLTAPFNIYRYKYNAENYEFVEVNCQKPLTH